MSNQKVKSSKDRDYFETATDWDIDQTARTKASEKRAWLVAAAFGALSLVLSIAIASLIPLKTIEDRIVRVDTVTGVVDVQRTEISGGRESYEEVVDKYWIRRYVRTREGFDFNQFQQIYKEVGLLSSSEEQKSWFGYFRKENPEAPVNTYGDRQRVRVKIRSVVMVGPKLANVHYTKIVETAAGNSPKLSYWIATVPYRYVNAPMSEDDREINPLGFQVLPGYRSDPETDVITEGDHL